ncbi:hypothetical protein [Pseudomonas tremae]|uniref:hypothetical protein n=1 Tax=Pseudomonas tremae TaxID=200454 RepID=UPI001F257005|nr:hypothetical protein [Pseudomonas tremae]MCF5746625.1 hypothetical protein [Pseudomonas tremae]UQB39466.1 hypothetical protein I9H09_24235 [Pseudomonas tremae]
MSTKALSKTPKVLKALSKKTEHLHEHLGEKVALCNYSKRLILTLALRCNWGYRLLVAANSATGLGRSINNRRNGAPITIAGAFFVPAILCYGGLRRDTFGCAGFLLSRSANPAQSATLPRLAAKGGSSSTMGASPMTTLIPSKIRTIAHRRMALSALRANSSLSVRLKRYNHHMSQVRALEAQGGAL